MYLAVRSASLAGVEEGLAERIRLLGGAAADLQRGVASFTGNLASLGQQAAAAALG